jgi:hypothetical protein
VKWIFDPSRSISTTLPVNSTIPVNIDSRFNDYWAKLMTSVK